MALRLLADEASGAYRGGATGAGCDPKSPVFSPQEPVTTRSRTQKGERAQRLWHSTSFQTWRTRTQTQTWLPVFGNRHFQPTSWNHLPLMGSLFHLSICPGSFCSAPVSCIFPCMQLPVPFSILFVASTTGVSSHPPRLVRGGHLLRERRCTCVSRLLSP